MAISSLNAAAASMTAPMAQNSPVQDAVAPRLGSEFADLITKGVERANTEQLKADAQVEKLVETQGANIHETMIALSRADITTRLTLKVGQKLVQAYQEISRMNI